MVIIVDIDLPFPLSSFKADYFTIIVINFLIEPPCAFLFVSDKPIIEVVAVS